MSRLTVASALLAVACAAGAALLWPAPTPAAALTVPDADRDVGDRGVGERFDVTFTLRNGGPRPVTVLNVQPTCGQNCCVEPRAEGGFVVPPGADAPLTYAVTVHAAGEFGFPFRLFADDGGARMIELSLRGRGVGPR